MGVDARIGRMRVWPPRTTALPGCVMLSGKRVRVPAAVRVRAGRPTATLRMLLHRRATVRDPRGLRGSQPSSSLAATRRARARRQTPGCARSLPHAAENRRICLAAKRWVAAPWLAQAGALRASRTWPVFADTRVGGHVRSRPGDLDALRPPPRIFRSAPRCRSNRAASHRRERCPQPL